MGLLACSHVLVWFAFSLVRTLPNEDANFKKESYWEEQFTTHAPILRMLKRQFRNFRTDHVATMTIVFHASRPVTVRWFRSDPRQAMLTDSEVPGMLPVEGDSNYEVSRMVSGEVTATTISILKFKDRYPLEFETIITTTDGSMQYQLKTIVRQRRELRVEPIDCPEYLLMPPTKILSRKGGALDFQCALFVPKENSPFTNELTISRVRTYPGQSGRLKQQLDFENIVSIHKDTQDVTEELDNCVVVFGRRQRTRVGHVVYHVGMSTRNVTSTMTGIYQCIMERQNDRLFLTSTVLEDGGAPSQPTTTTTTANQHVVLEVDLVSCEKNYDRRRAVVLLSMGVATCIRCRSTFQPTPTISIYRQDVELSTTGYGEGVARFVNVADAGVAELVYVIHHASPALHAGRYACVARSNVTVAKLNFQISFE